MMILTGCSPVQRNNRAEEIDMFSLPLALFLSVGAVAVFSFVAVAVWSDNRRKEREAYYRSEALKKMIEAQGTGASSAVELLRQEERIAALCIPKTSSGLIRNAVTTV